MSNHFDLGRGRIALIATAISVAALVVAPIAANAAAVNLATTAPFVVLGGAGVTNTETSVLNGDLGVWPGTSLTGFAPPTVVNGATHASDGVAAQAQSDLTTGYNVAAGQPVPPGNDLTGTDLGGLDLNPGAYGFSSSAQLTGQLTLDAHGDPSAQFVFVIGTTLNTTTASSVVLVNGASPCNVFWKVGSSATFGTSTAFEGNVLALESISVGRSATVLGRLLARNGEVTLINDVLTAPQCATSTETGTTPPTDVTSPISTTTTPETGAVAPTSSTATGTTPIVSKVLGKRIHHSSTTDNGSSTVTHGGHGPNGTPVKVSGKKIAKIVVKVDNQTVETSHAPSLKTNVNGTPGTHTVTVRVTYRDHTPGKTTTFRIHVPSPAPLHPRPGPSAFTG